jgi:hypothetical protein
MSGEGEADINNEEKGPIEETKKPEPVEEIPQTEAQMTAQAEEDDQDIK